MIRSPMSERHRGSFDGKAGGEARERSVRDYDLMDERMDKVKMIKR